MSVLVTVFTCSGPTVPSIRLTLNRIVNVSVTEVHAATGCALICTLVVPSAAMTFVLSGAALAAAELLLAVFTLASAKP